MKKANINIKGKYKSDEMTIPFKMRIAENFSSDFEAYCYYKDNNNKEN